MESKYKARTADALHVVEDCLDEALVYVEGCAPETFDCLAKIHEASQMCFEQNSEGANHPEASGSGDALNMTITARPEAHEGLRSLIRSPQVSS